MSTVLDALANYLQVLASSADTTPRAEERRLYEMHLALGARMFVAAARQQPSDLAKLVQAERRNYGWSFLPGDEGDRAERAFNAFAETVGLGLPKA